MVKCVIKDFKDSEWYHDFTAAVLVHHSFQTSGKDWYLSTVSTSSIHCKVHVPAVRIFN